MVTTSVPGGSSGAPISPRGYVTTSIPETASTQAIAAFDVITAPLSGSVAGSVQTGRITEITTTGTGTLTGSGHTIALAGRNIHAGSGTLSLFQIGVEGICQNTGGGTVFFGVGVAGHMNNLSGSSTYTNYANFYSEFSNITAGTFTSLCIDYYSPDHSAVANMPSTRYGYANVDAGKILYQAGPATFLNTISTTSSMTSLTFLPAVVALTPSASITLNPTLADVFTLVPNTTGNILTSSVNAKGQRLNIIITTSGVSSFTITFTTNFKTTGTLATGTTSGKVFVISFVSDGVNYNEVSRTTAM